MALPEQTLLGPGDRAPNFVLPATDGLFWVFYERVRGLRNAVVLLPRQWAGRRRALAALSEAWPALQDAGIDLFAISDDAPAGDRALAEALGVPFLLFSDPQARFYGQYVQGFGLPRERPACLLLDENQRVLGRLDPQAEGLAQAILAFYAARPVAGRAETLDGVAPVLIVPEVLPPETCKALIERWHRLGHEEGVAQGRDEAGRDVVGVAHGYKKRRDHVVTEAALAQQLARLIGRRIGPELAKAFYFTKFRFDDFVVTCYDAARGDYFRPHRDNTTEQTRDRMFALTLNLNTGDYEGGGLRFAEYGQSLYAPPAGGAILFSCSLIHEATPVTRGQRFTLLSFLRDPAPPRQAGGKLGVWGGQR